MKRILKACVVGLAVAVSMGSQADEPFATLSNVTGTVLVNQGGVYRDVNPGDTPALNSGDRVVALNGSSVDVVYQKTCVVHVPANGMLTLGGADDCALGIAQIQNAEAAGITGGLTADTFYTKSLLGDLAIFTAATAAAIYGADELSDDDNQPISPE